jgi:hypothetical protein
MADYNNLSHAHSGTIIGDFDTPGNNVIDLEDNIVPQAIDLTED